MSEEDASTKFNCDLLLAESEGSVEYGAANGLSKDNMVMVGDPDYDLAFTKRNYIENKKFQKLLFQAIGGSAGGCRSSGAGR